ncbi:GDSL-type esterase/lipase family protein [Isoptericola croceus]|uniref:GDSL-type esterase/lipase family protein n=1 Tax=Isoptericola croceus TaxID=3031406 RepID=UPI0023F9BAD6|nr:GDSL-type esterase/lipase family protein [Isoptericola croceus]
MPDRPRDPRICFLGDSYTAAVGDPSALGWVGRVVAAAHAAGHTLTAYPLGVRGETSAQVADRIDTELRPRLVPGADNRAVLAVGVNDTVATDDGPRLSAAQSEDALRRAVATARRRTADGGVLVVGPPAVDDDAQNDRLRALDDRFARTCHALGVPYVATFAATVGHTVWRHEVAAGDSYHPGAAGYAAFAEVVEPAFLAWVDPAAGGAPAACG